jgi:alkanesulfonate monooxygenase SsuD/methylene tetrahydromethanopterin reductase-like flavin-dependent oxidoreductase (luciferase family)
MRTYWFTEDAYHLLPDQDTYESIRVNLPNAHFDPVKGHELYNWYLDLWGMADEMGLDIMNNEHHQTATCMVPAAPLMMSILARETKRARLLILGNPISNRRQPIRVAEEMAMIDVISEGRLECGFVRGVPYEAAPANMTPLRGSERLWEAHDLILKCWTSHDEPFNFEGRWFHGRQINVWPRPYQQPHPPVWITMGGRGSTRRVAQHKHVGAVFLAGYPRIREIFDGYREDYLELHGEHAPFDRLAYLGLIYVSDNEAKAREGAEKLLWYMTANKVPGHWSNPPGYHPPKIAAQIMRGARGGAGIPLVATLDDQMARGNVFAGTPDQVFEQIKSFWEYSGGFGNLLMMGQAGFLTHAETENSMRLFTQEVYPRLKELEAAADPAETWEKSKSIPHRDNVVLDNFALEFVR